MQFIFDSILRYLNPALSLWLLVPIIKILPSLLYCHFPIIPTVASAFLAIKNIGADTKATIW